MCGRAVRDTPRVGRHVGSAVNGVWGWGASGDRELVCNEAVLSRGRKGTGYPPSRHLFVFDAQTTI